MNLVEQKPKHRDGKWAKKGAKSSFGYKLHTKTDMTYGFIRCLETTPANVHDGQIDLTEEGEVAYRDRRYAFAPCKGYNASMKRAVRGHPQGIRDKMRNQRILESFGVSPKLSKIACKRSAWERPYAVIKNIFKAGHSLVTTTIRQHTKNIFSYLNYNLYQLATLQKNTS